MMILSNYLGEFQLTIYDEQYARMMRWYEKFKEIDSGKKHGPGRDDDICFEDIIYCFFMNCFHFFDWIENDDGNPIDRSTLQSFVDKNPSMRKCRDICHSAKHFTLKRKTAGQDPKIVRKKKRIEIGKSEEEMLSAKYTFHTADGQIDAFTLATDCVKAWDEFMGKHHL